jgi:hypothetical protein
MAINESSAAPVGMSAPGPAGVSTPAGTQEQSMTRLVSGILDDAQELVRQQFALMKHEIRKDLREAKEASLSLVAGGVLLGMGLVMFGFMLVYLIYWLISPGTAGSAAAPQLLWVCFLIVGCFFALCSLGLFYVGKRKIEAINPLPEETLTAARENLQWTTKPK